MLLVNLDDDYYGLENGFLDDGIPHALCALAYIMGERQGLCTKDVAAGEIECSVCPLAMDPCADTIYVRRCIGLYDGANIADGALVYSDKGLFGGQVVGIDVRQIGLELRFMTIIKRILLASGIFLSFCVETGFLGVLLGIDARTCVIELVAVRDDIGVIYGVLTFSFERGIFAPYICLLG